MKLAPEVPAHVDRNAGGSRRIEAPRTTIHFVHRWINRVNMIGVAIAAHL